MRICPRQIEQPEFGKLPEQGQVVFEVVNEFGHARLGALNEGERHHRWSERRIAQKHRELVHEIANRGLRITLSVIGPRGQKVAGNLKSLAEKPDLFRFRFEITSLGIGEDKIEHGDALTDELDFMFAAIAKVLPPDLTIEAARKDVIDHAALWKALRAGMFLSMELGPKCGGPFAPMGGGKAEELTRHEVARVGGNEIKESRFRLGVAEGLQSIEMGRRDGHSARIPSVRSWSFRMRRRRDASSGWL